MKVVEQYETPEFRAGDKYPQRENVDEPLRLAIKVNFIYFDKSRHWFFW